jgi:hypothetical protein
MCGFIGPHGLLRSYPHMLFYWIMASSDKMSHGLRYENYWAGWIIYYHKILSHCNRTFLLTESLVCHEWCGGTNARSMCAWPSLARAGLAQQWQRRRWRCGPCNIAARASSHCEVGWRCQSVEEGQADVTRGKQQRQSCDHVNVRPVVA